MKHKRKNIPSTPIATVLLRWYDKQARVLPWRARTGKKANPYHVLLSEFMLQQTTVATVIPYYIKFLQRWPRLEDLARARLDEVRAQWAGLGYYRRAAFLHRCAQALSGRGGRLPDTEAGLLELPGIGAYTAAAIAAIAYDRPANVMDGNIARVMARLFRHKGPRKALHEKAGALVPQKRPGDYAQALMDLGATVCTPKKPRCGDCPIAAYCLAHDRGDADSFPPAKAWARVPKKYGVVFILKDSQGRFLLRRRKEGGLLGGMWEFPGTEWDTSRPGTAKIAQAAPQQISWRRGPVSVPHVFSHFRLELSLRLGHSDRAIRPMPREYRWISEAEFSRLALPTVMKKVWKAAAS